MKSEIVSSTERRSFLTRLKGTAAAFAIAGTAKAQVKPIRHFEPTRHDKDDWLEQESKKHRIVFDATRSDGFGEALLFATNYLNISHGQYGLANKELAVLIVARHRAAAFGYNDEMWAKYSEPLSKRAMFTDPKTKEPPKVNLYSSRDYLGLLPSGNAAWPGLVTMGVQLAVCESATHAYAGMIAQAAGITEPAAFAELTRNLVPNARMVPAGIITVTRAQERGYSLVST